MENLSAACRKAGPCGSLPPVPNHTQDAGSPPAVPNHAQDAGSLPTVSFLRGFIHACLLTVSARTFPPVLCFLFFPICIFIIIFSFLYFLICASLPALFRSLFSTRSFPSTLSRLYFRRKSRTPTRRRSIRHKGRTPAPRRSVRRAGTLGWCQEARDKPSSCRPRKRHSRPRSSASGSPRGDTHAARARFRGESGRPAGRRRGRTRP